MTTAPTRDARDPRDVLRTARRWVVKIGSSMLTANGRGLDHEAIARWSAQIARLRDAECEVVVVSSGAVAQGMSRLALKSRPKAVHTLQAAAAVGQMGLVRAWDTALGAHHITTAQILITHDDVGNRQRYLNARNALRELLAFGVVPVVNENDTVAVDEIRLGDNDRLGAMTAGLIEADVLVILTDQQGLFTADPRTHADATLIRDAMIDDAALTDMAGDSKGALGRGGMKTKLEAAQMAARSGAATLIAYGHHDDVLDAALRGDPVGTLLMPRDPRAGLPARKRWIADQLQRRGRLYLDSGATDALQSTGRSLLPVGVTRVEGRFQRGDVVGCIAPDGHEVARGLINYSADEVSRLLGARGADIANRLGYPGDPELIHRDNLVVR
ncbi:MAG: glutamate 5-kinase [Pseudomonadota bacterium]|nr:glutamate 5-kinase [Pseudomonadota bacterium]